MIKHSAHYRILIRHCGIILESFECLMELFQPGPKVIVVDELRNYIVVGAIMFRQTLRLLEFPAVHDNVDGLEFWEPLMYSLIKVLDNSCKTGLERAALITPPR